MNISIQPITVARLSSDQRNNLLYLIFGEHLMILGESLIHRWARKNCAQYKESGWNLYQVSGGAYYMAPDITGPSRVVIPGKWFDHELSSDAIGISATLSALSRLGTELAYTGAPGEEMIERYHYLRHFALKHHCEGTLIISTLIESRLVPEAS